LNKKNIQNYILYININIKIINLVKINVFNTYPNNNYMKSHLTYICSFCICLLCISSCKQKSYLNSSLSPETRTRLLMKQMTLKEKIEQMNLDFNEPPVDLTKAVTSDKVSDIIIKKENKKSLTEQWIRDVKQGKMGTTRNIYDYKTANLFQKYAEESRLKIPLFIVQNHVHGVGRNGFTIFPTYISMASTFDPELVRKSGAVIAKESRLKGINWTFAPTVDISHDSRWGRTGETWGEDPYLASKMAVAMVNGLQYDNEAQYRIVSCLKHFAGGGQAQNGLNFAPVDISERSLRENFLPPFKAAIDAGAKTIMASHNDFQGVPCHCNHFLLTDILRKEYKFDGIVISDWQDIERLVSLHKVAKDWNAAVEMAINAGVDIHNNGKNFTEVVYKLVKEGKISKKRINETAKRILRIKFELGLFENRYVSETGRDSLICTPYDKNLALKLARESIVLLKNKANILPLTGNKKILVTGTNVDNYTILGDWVSDKKFDNVIKIKDGFIKEKSKEIDLNCYSYKYEKYYLTEDIIKETVKRAKKVDVVVLVLGGNDLRADHVNKTGGENTDVQDLELFGNQLELLKRVKATGKPIVTILIGGRNLALENTEKYSDAIVQAWEPGMMGGQAIAEMIYGKYSPSGRLAMSVPRTTGQVNIWYNHHPSLYFRNFRFGKMGPLYDFGYGLSYTTFKYSNLKYEPTITAGKSEKVSINVTNTGKMASDEVVLCYINDKVSSIVTPVKKLVAFKRISLEPQETKTVTFDIKPDAMALWDINMKRVIEPGEFSIMIGNQKGVFTVK